MSNQEDKAAKPSFEKLQSDIAELSSLTKSMCSCFQKQGRRLLTIRSTEMNKHMETFYQSKEIDFSFNEFEDYSDLLSQQSREKIAQVSTKLDQLALQLRTMANKNKNKTSEILYEAEYANFLEYKKAFEAIWKEEYFLILNYRMAVAAKELERWSQATTRTINKEILQKQINSMF